MDRSTSRRVLVVDDEADIREVVTWMLAEEGYEVCGARHGAEALPLARDWRPDLIILDLIILDLNMPIMDGPTFRAHQRADPACADIPIVAISAGHNLARWRSALDPCELVAKPFDVPDVLAAVERCIRPPDA